jgi:hypothetical protein
MKYQDLSHPNSQHPPPSIVPAPVRAKLGTIAPKIEAIIIAASAMPIIALALSCPLFLSSFIFHFHFFPHLFEILAYRRNVGDTT